MFDFIKYISQYQNDKFQYKIFPFNRTIIYLNDILLGIHSKFRIRKKGSGYSEITGWGEEIDWRKCKVKGNDHLSLICHVGSFLFVFDDFFNVNCLPYIKNGLIWSCLRLWSSVICVYVGEVSIREFLFIRSFYEYHWHRVIITNIIQWPTPTFLSKNATDIGG